MKQLVNFVELIGISNFRICKVDKSPVFIHPSGHEFEIEVFGEGETRSLSFPVMFLYPEYQQMDVIAHFNELDTFKEHLSEIFSSPAEWDCKMEYFQSNINNSLNLYIVGYDSQFDPCLIKLDPEFTIETALKLNDVYMFINKPTSQDSKGGKIEGILKIYAVIKNSQFEKDFEKDFLRF